MPGDVHGLPAPVIGALDGGINGTVTLHRLPVTASRTAPQRLSDRPPAWQTAWISVEVLLFTG